MKHSCPSKLSGYYSPKFPVYTKPSACQAISGGSFPPAVLLPARTRVKCPSPPAPATPGPQGTAHSAARRETPESEPLDGIPRGPLNFAPAAGRGPDLALRRRLCGGPPGSAGRAGLRGWDAAGLSRSDQPGAGRLSAGSGRPSVPGRPAQREEPAAVTRQGGNASARRPCREGGSASALGSAHAARGGNAAEPGRYGAGGIGAATGSASVGAGVGAPGWCDGLGRGVPRPRQPPLFAANVTFPRPLAAPPPSAGKPPGGSECKSRVPRRPRL